MSLDEGLRTLPPFDSFACLPSDASQHSAKTLYGSDQIHESDCDEVMNAEAHRHDSRDQKRFALSVAVAIVIAAIEQAQRLHTLAPLRLDQH